MLVLGQRFGSLVGEFGEPSQIQVALVLCQFPGPLSGERLQVVQKRTPDESPSPGFEDLA